MGNGSQGLSGLRSSQLDAQFWCEARTADHRLYDDTGIGSRQMVLRLMKSDISLDVCCDVSTRQGYGRDNSGRGVNVHTMIFRHTTPTFVKAPEKNAEWNACS